MLGFLRSKTLIVLVLAVFILYLSNDFSLIDIKETAIIVALGIDRIDDGYEVSAQIAVPKSTEQTASNGGTVISAKGQTVGIALENIGVRTGWYPKLSFCNVLLLGERMFDENAMESIDYFLRTIKIQDTVELCATEGTAREIMTASSPLNEVSAFSVTKILQKDAESSSSVSYESLREFAIGYYSKSKFSFMPFIRLVPTEETENSENGNQATGNFSSEKSPKKGDTDNKIFDATTTLLLTEGRRATTLNLEQTLAFNLLMHNVSEASIEIKNTEYCGKKTNLFIAMRDNKGRARLRIVNGRPILEITLSVVARIDDSNVSVSPTQLASGYVVPDNVLRDIEMLMEKLYVQIFNKAIEADCDAFEIKDKLYRTQNKYYEGYKEIILKECALSVNVHARSFK